MTTKRGRKSSGDLTVVRLAGARIEPLDWLNEAEAKEWTSIVNSLPADYFRPADSPLLGAYCVAAALHKQAREEVDAHGMTLELDSGRKQMNPAVTVLQYQAGTMAQLAVKLRLAPSARYTPKSTATKVGVTALPVKPWEVAAS